jgi:hypothetical protein
MRGPDGLNDKAVLAGDESATIPRIDPLALHLAYFTLTVKSRIFPLVLGTSFFFIWNVVANRLVALQMAELWGFDS